MKYTMENLPAWLKSLPKGAIRIGLAVFNTVLSSSKDEERARKAAWSAIKAKYEKSGDTWQAKKAAQSSERGETIHFRAARQADDTGLVWEVVIIAPGLSLSRPRFYWSDEVLEEAAGNGTFNKVDINAYELTTDFFSHLSVPDMGMLEDVKRYLASKKVGWIEKSWWEPGVGIKGTIHFLPEQGWLPRTIKQGMERGNEDVLGLSIDSRIKGFDVVVDEQTVIWVTQIVSASSVDVVTHPAAGGKFLRAVAGLMQKEQTVNRAKFLALIKKQRPDLLNGLDESKISDDDLLQIAQQAMEAKADDESGKDPGKAESGAAGAGEEQRAAQGLPKGEVKTMIADEIKVVEQRAACGRMLDTTIAGSDLPEMALARVKASFDGKVFAQKDLDDAVKAEKDYLAAMSTVPGFNLGDQSRARVGLGSVQKIEAAVDLMFGLGFDDVKEQNAMMSLEQKPIFEQRAAQDYEDVPSLGGLREMYVLLTGDTEINGSFNRDNLPAELRAAQAITSSTFSYAIGNTMSRRLVKDYRSLDMKEDLLISTRKPVKDFKLQEAVNVGYFPDLADVDPETADYVEIAGVTDEEATYSLGQKGNLMTITRKTIINDDVSVIQRLISRLGRAGRRTHGKYVWNFFISNTNCSDGTAWFTAPHLNLGTAALSHATALTAYLALAKMTEMDSGERIGLLDGGAKPVLVYPVDLMDTGEKIVNDDHYYSANDLTTKTRNPLKNKIKGAQLSLLSDVNDWGLLMPPSEVDMVEMGYLNGRQDPEMFLADSPQSEQVFVADKIRYKIRHEYAGTVIDCRSGYKAQVI